MKYVNELISGEYEHWKIGDIVFINSGTGTGKSHFIRNELSDYAMKESSLILFIFNRSKLEEQNKNTLYDEFNFIVTTETYQGIEHEIINSGNYDFSKYKYIVCDEYHYFTEDSTFNDNSDISLNSILNLKNHIRIFMSATGHVLYNFFVQEYEPKLKLNGNKIWTYTQKQDYKNISSLFFYNDIEVVERFIQDKFPSEKDKILWFCGSVEQAAKLHSKHSNSSFMCSKDPKNRKYFNLLSHDSIISEDKNVTFKGKYLFTTKVLDNGFDLKDENIKLIVCDYFDLTTILQCIGRKRMTSEHDKVHVVLKNYSNQSLAGFRTKLKQIIKEADTLFSGGVDSWLKVVDRFGRKANYIIYDTVSDKGKFDSKKRISRPKYLKAKADLANLDKIINDNSDLNRFRELNGEKRVSDAFIQFIMSELDKKSCYILDDIYGNQDLNGFLESIIGKVMLTTKDRTELINKIDVRSDGHQLKGIESLNAALKERGLNYQIKEFETSRIEQGKKKKYKSAWKVVRI